MITYPMLQIMDACPEQLDEFRRLFPGGGIRPTPELCIQHSWTFDWAWAARQLLTPQGLDRYLVAENAAYVTCRDAQHKAFSLGGGYFAYADAREAAVRKYYEAIAEAFGTIWCQENPQ